MYLHVCCFRKMLRNYYFNCNDFETRRMRKKSSSISTKDTVVNLYTRNSHFCMAVLKLRRKMYFAFWYFDALVCFIMFCFLYGHQFYFRQKIDHVQTRDNQGIATYIFTISVSFCISISLQLPVIKARVSMCYFMCLYL